MSSRIHLALEPGVLDRLARLACTVTGAPAALVLRFDAGRTVAVGRHGWNGATPIPELGIDPAPARRRGAPELRVAASCPLTAGEDAEPLGTLVVLDAAPRDYAPADLQALDDVAAAAAAELARMRAEAETPPTPSVEFERAARMQAEAGEKRYAFLAEVSSLLDASLDYQTTFQKLARLVVPALADYCLIDEAEPGGGLRRIARAHVDPEKEKILYTNTYHPPVSEEEDLSRHPVLRVIRTGLPLLVADFTTEMVEVIAHDDDHRGRLAQLDLRSYIIAPLAARGRVLGAITLAASAESGRRYRATDVALAEEVARRAALAIDNARMYTLAQEAIRAREAVLAVVSHDLRNPLASILLNATMLLDMTPDGTLDPWMDDNLRQIVGSVEQTNRLITDLLDVARMEESGGIPLDRSPVDARPLVAAAVRMLRPVAAARGVELADDTRGPLPVMADPDRVVQVLSNLLGNAVKFTEPGGHVRVTAETYGGEQWFAVTDTGVGIPPEHQPYVFDRFRQVGRDRRGVGLGLPIARGIVEGHGGRIWVDSRPGTGTTIHFTLPAATGSESAA
ncbi:GAF domain-containing sensor histidine kinase [Longimicrobium sp.]|uniref:sensor histidine kinase n=1 Tax=Longimicrobium sp. TaxID=2029185 RepID=UPI002CE079D7|nr:GAF domain-containing sensor histidine kinase [Longimicrobium sp.]HSU15386.1 GAF domain-containing sensor histidine kinase [Longimicrobium sp.]